MCSALSTRAALPRSRLPNAWPAGTSVPQKNGINFLLRSSGVAAKKSAFSAVSEPLGTPPPAVLSVVINASSAPLNTSCQRNPSIVINTT